MFINAIKSIIDLLKLRKDVKKTDLEIEKLQREKKAAESMIEIASLEDILKFDAKAKELIIMTPCESGIKRTSHRRIIILLLIAVLIIIAVAAAIYKFFA